MPKHFEGLPDPSIARDSRFDIEPNQESRLLAQAKAVGIDPDEVGAFFVVLAADLPANIENGSYDIFSEEELRSEAEKHDGWFYDEDNRRLVGTILPAATLVSRMRSSQ